jgi:hypothetical protein
LFEAAGNVQVLQLLPDDLSSAVVKEFCVKKPLKSVFRSALSWPLSLLHGWLRNLTSLDLCAPHLHPDDAFKLLSLLPESNSIQVLHIDFPAGPAAPTQAASSGSASTGYRATVGNLMALEAAAQHLSRKLRVLGIHGVSHLTTQHRMQLSRVCTCLADSVTAFALTAADVSGDVLPHVPQRVKLKRLLFRAIAQPQQLATLAVPQWEALVGSNTSAVAPLQRMPHLKSILVDDVAKGPPFDVAGLNFKHVTDV